MINLDELEKLIVFLLSKLKAAKGNLIEINEDFYWDISPNEIYNAYKEPEALTLGQLSDEINELKRLLELKDEAIPYDLKRIAEIIKYLGYTQSSF